MYKPYFLSVLVLQLTLIFAVPSFTQAQNAVQRFDDRVLIDLSNHRTPQKTGVFLFLSKYNTAVNLAVPAGLLAGGVIGDDKGMRQNSLYVFSSTALNFGFNNLMKVIFKRKRPFNANTNIHAVYQPTSYSFPSGHASSSFTTATALSQAYSKWYVVAPAYLWAGSVSFSRLYLGVHYPSDVAVGALTGAGTALSLRSLRPD
ncbi:phosphatase PAP2 family protein [Pedobacter sp. AW31-3R]|uniref:phosphatase PAP2 family protein n=1 Tax=Pedobacter sp. AW31-3R TaxID=3445781 RepID=UPI003F9F591E